MTQCCSAVVAVPCKLGHGQGLLLCLSLPAGDYQPLAQLPQHQLCKPASQGKELRYNGCSHAMGGCCSRHTEAEHTHTQANGCTPERMQCAQPAVSRTDTRGQQRWQLLLLQFVAVSREHTHTIGCSNWDTQWLRDTLRTHNRWTSNSSKVGPGQCTRRCYCALKAWHGTNGNYIERWQEMACHTTQPSAGKSQPATCTVMLHFIGTCATGSAGRECCSSLGIRCHMHRLLPIKWQTDKAERPHPSELHSGKGQARAHRPSTHTLNFSTNNDIEFTGRLAAVHTKAPGPHSVHTHSAAHTADAATPGNCKR
jgi:hypothetical protein